MGMPLEQAGKVVVLPLDKLRTDRGTQPRCQLTDPVVVNDYAELLLDGVELPPGVAFFDGAEYVLAEGFQRHAAHALAGRTHMACSVYPGGVREARLHAAGSNARHGLRRTTDDMRRAVLMVLADPEGKSWTDEEIARHCQVPRGTVRAYRESSEQELEEEDLFGSRPRKPDEPDFARADKAVLEERARRAARKYLRFALMLGGDYVELLREELAEMERRKPKPKEAPAPAGPERLTLNGAIPDK